MAGKQAKILSDDQLNRVLHLAYRGRNALRDRVVVLLSFKAGLRAMEIARIERQHVTDGDARVADCLSLENRLCKKGSGRTVPMQPLLREAIAELLPATPGARPNWPLILSERAFEHLPDRTSGRPRAMRPSSVGYWFYRAYHRLALAGCSSHSGRRTFITRGARRIAEAGGSLIDVMRLAGHANVGTTQRYVDGDSEAQRRLIAMI